MKSLAVFSDRVRRSLGRITEGGNNRRIVVFTSGGVIGFVVQSVLGAPASKALEINWRVRNSSITEFLFSGGRFSLDSFNATPHLDDQRLWTFR